jgi:hypothetical protein
MGALVDAILTAATACCVRLATSFGGYGSALACRG